MALLRSLGGCCHSGEEGRGLFLRAAEERTFAILRFNHRWKNPGWRLGF